MAGPIEHEDCQRKPQFKHICRNLKAICFALAVFNSKEIWSGICTLTVSRHLVSPAGLGVIFLSGLWCASTSISSALAIKDGDDGVGAGCSWDKKPGLAPRIFESRTTHTRLFPARHSFSYSYLLVGVPVGWNGSAGHVLSSDCSHQAKDAVGAGHGGRCGWFSIHADDYLGRGGRPHVDGLRGKLDNFLESQGVERTRYPSAYLVTAPRFCGFSFNPVSFWYLYDHHGRLGAMILEVNNTFDERRIYYLPRNADDESATTSKSKFTDHWEKDFHVSPFNDRHGSYSLTCTDPFDDENETETGSSGAHGTGVEIDNTIVLNSEEGKPKIVARVFSTSAGLDPFRMSRLQSLVFVTRWWWVGFMTNPRILREARKLWTKKLQVFYRPEVQKSSIGRNETAEERILEPFFRRVLEQMASRSGTRRITYIPAAGEGRGKPVHLVKESDTGANGAAGASGTAHVEIRIVTPAFYTEMVREPDLLTTFDRFCFSPQQDQAMVHVSDVSSVREALVGAMKAPPPLPALSVPVRESRLARVNHRLRSGRSLFLVAMEALQSFVFPSRGRATSGGDEQGIGHLDSFVQATCSTTSEVLIYDRTCLKVLLADRLALGYVGLLEWYTTVAWVGAVATSAWHINGLMHSPTQSLRSLWFWTAMGAKLGTVYGLSFLRG
ncbi:hypothetical protein PV08_10681 [Exophiala spinifera]|uniref:DUF1365 domain-containing protein n=1 Tax=Exophiala spinifera TaxID=91928 RepID=A0A0D1Y8R6_9EURO|nr:uncharacterized protein PV08_10681 [Exophiala spinifera]KIW11381.1 hypothetical protein PV08_10681 [Exophiala spinifera]